MSSKSGYTKKILRALAEKPAIRMTEIANSFEPEGSQSLNGPKPLLNKEGKYAVLRSLKNLVDSGYAEIHNSGQKNYARITKEGKRKMSILKLDDEMMLVNTSWDGFWRIVLLDLPESRKNERESLRYLLKKAGFVCLKNSAWISPYPFEHLFINIKKDLGISTEMMIIVTQFIDEETKKVLFEAFGK